jgi:hypothetical protein
MLMFVRIRRSTTISDGISDIAIARDVHRGVVVRRVHSHTTVITPVSKHTPSEKGDMLVITILCDFYSINMW